MLKFVYLLQWFLQKFNFKFEQWMYVFLAFGLHSKIDFIVCKNFADVSKTEELYFTLECPQSGIFGFCKNVEEPLRP